MTIVSLAQWLACKPRKRPISTIVLHATAGGSSAGAISTLRQRGFGYHAIIEDQKETDGKVIKCVPDSRVAYHAGVSVGPEGPGVNSYSLGLSFVNLNNGTDPYSKAQVEAALERCASWCQAYPSVKYLTTHYWVSPGRKTDPRNAPGWDVEDFALRLNARLGRKIILFTGGRKAI